MNDSKTGRFVKSQHWREPRLFRDRSFLIEHYVDRRLSTHIIAGRFNVTPGAVIYWLRRHNIPRRKGSEAAVNRKDSSTPEILSDYRRLMRFAFPDRYRLSGREHYHRNKKRCNALHREWRKRNPDYVSRRCKLDLNFRIRTRLRERLCKAVRHGRCGRASQFLGCSIPDFKIYLESRFDSGMSWENYGQGRHCWQIDHIVPCAIFDLTKPEHQRRCFHFSNMQPMWMIENVRKGCRVFSDQFNLL